MTINGFIFGTVVLCVAFWALAHAYDDYQARQVRKSFRRDKN